MATARRTHDNPDPNLILPESTSRHRKPPNRTPTTVGKVDQQTAISVAAITACIDRIEELCSSLPKSVPIGTKGDKMFDVIHRVYGFDSRDPAPTFTRRMDLLFARDCRNENGRFHYIRRGEYGMSYVVQYLRSIQWATDEIPFPTASAKLEEVLKEMEVLCATSPQRSKRRAADAVSDAEDTQRKKLTSTRNGTASVMEIDDDDESEDEFSPINEKESSSDEDMSGSEAERNPADKKKKRSHKLAAYRNGRRKKQSVGHSQTDPIVLGEDGMLADVVVPELNPSASDDALDSAADMTHFFEKPVLMVGKRRGDPKPHRKCKLCKTDFVADPSTGRRHLASTHKPAYYDWVNKVGFESRLEADVKARKIAAANAAKELHQKTLDPHLRERPERVVAYTDKRWLDAALEWLIATDQPIQALAHPKFKTMIDIASRATDGVKIPGRHSTRAAILDLFQVQMTKLRVRLHSAAVSGKLHVTCDAWQAGNTEGYFVTTGHWIEETSPGVWVLQEAILGFVRLANSHNGTRLGTALYKILKRLGLQQQLGYCTCDNASNNTTMLEELAKLLLQDGVIWDPIERRINCLAHVINLATQKLISAYSKSPHFDPHTPDAHIPDTTLNMRDEIGLVRAIAVKERSSAKRKELFKTIQLKAKPAEAAKQMILDMKIRWSSTYSMLHRGYLLKDEIDKFVFQIAGDETGEKRKKLMALTVQHEEWERVEKFVHILKSAEKAQNAFSSDLRSTLHRAIPALEGLHTSWTGRSQDLTYSDFWDALEPALEKVDEYYQKTANTDAYMFAMVLDPRKKWSHFEKHWDTELQEKGRNNLKKTFKARYEEIHAKESAQASAPDKQKSRPANKSQMRALTPDDDDDDVFHIEEIHLDPSKPWLDEFKGWFTAVEAVPKGMSTIQWWGRNYHRYPVWGSLARDYLAIMASSVSSERAFSSAGITISKRRNRLRGDIVEALQCLKCLIRRELLFRDQETINVDADEFDAPEAAVDGEEGWDCFLDDDDDNYDADVDMD